GRVKKAKRHVWSWLCESAVKAPLGLPHYPEDAEERRSSSAEFAEQGLPGVPLAGRTHQRAQLCNLMLELSIKPVVGFGALQLLSKSNGVADGKVSGIFLSQDANRAWYQRRNDRSSDGDSFTDNVGTPLEVRGERQQVRARQQ